ncbi:hypothetical protein [Adhaeribacter terrigena]|uniref:hypothetical protein n=1 Tax=Adhaeribacter terrigena TaxID=2793070 RepID=UPI00190CFD95|nr:hypothetical protein [Adhaeribacter terrigena]
MLLWFCCIGFARAQVPNDHIAHRRVLKTEEAVWSNTTGCTVQRSCVDESLTGKCVEYHNDQWFEFTPATSGNYFVNISGQTCRDTRGVQLVVLTGKPCEPATYNIISCTSLASQDDIFVLLQALQSRQTYLLNVDGYLNDQCRFKIEVSTKPNGIPAAVTPVIPAGNFVQNGNVTLHWALPDSISATGFRILRREASQFKAVENGRKAVARDSYGKLLKDYSFSDTLTKPGSYLYQVVAFGTTNEVPVLIKQEWRTLRNVANAPIWYQLPLEKYPNKAELAISITDAATGKILQRVVFRKQKNKPEQGRLLVNNWLAGGIKTIRVEIQERKKEKIISGSNFLVDLDK